MFKNLSLNNSITSTFLIIVSLVIASFAQAKPVDLTNTLYEYKVKQDGEITGYFMGQTAAYTSLLSVIVNGVERVPSINNHASNIYDYTSFGTASAGDKVVFKLHVNDTNDDWFSNMNMNSDGLNHMYSVIFNTNNNPILDRGLYVGFEDLRGLGDRDYNDLTAVFGNVSPVPEPSVWAMLGVGLLVMFLSSQRDHGSRRYKYC